MQLQLTVNGTSKKDIVDRAREIGTTYFDGPFSIAPFSASFIGPGTFTGKYFRAEVILREGDKVNLGQKICS